MDEYTRLLNEINSYFELDDIHMTTECISAFDLYKILDEKFQQLRNVISAKALQDKINSDRTVVRVIKKLFQRNEERFVESECDTICSSTKGNTAEILFSFEDSSRQSGCRYVHIYRDFESEEIYFDRHFKDREFVMKYYDDIKEYFDILEEFDGLLGFNIGGFSDSRCNQKFSDGFMKVKLVYDNRANVSIDISIIDTEDPDDIYNREWLNRKKIADVIDERKEEVLKKIPINISDLNVTCKTIVEPYLQKGKLMQKK